MVSKISGAFVGPVSGDDMPDYPEFSRAYTHQCDTCNAPFTSDQETLNHVDSLKNLTRPFDYELHETVWLRRGDDEGFPRNISVEVTVIRRFRDRQNHGNLYDLADVGDLRSSYLFRPEHKISRERQTPVGRYS